MRRKRNNVNIRNIKRYIHTGKVKKLGLEGGNGYRS
jgi:hypothetical protein